jgi:tetratricopeptide (TPR) repeat protein
MRLVASGEEGAVREAHAQYFLALAEDAEPRLTGPDQMKWLDWLEQEHDNLRAGLTWAQQGSADGAPRRAIGLRLGGALMRFWMVRGHLREGRTWLEGLLGRGGAQDASLAAGAVRAKALNGAATLATRQSDYARATVLYEESLAQYRALGHKPGIASTLNGLGHVAQDQGNYAQATLLYEESLALYRALGDTHGTANLLRNLGSVAHARGDDAQATVRYEESLALYRALGDRRGMAYALGLLGNAAHAQGDDARATIWYEESLILLRAIGDKVGIAATLGGLAVGAETRGDYARATALLAESLALSQELGDKGGMAAGLEDMARVVIASGTTAHILERAIQLCGAASALRAAIGAPLSVPGRAEQERTVGALRTALGKAAYEAAWAEGQAISLEQAIAYALEGTPPASGTPGGTE